MAENAVNFLLSKLNELISSELELIQGVDNEIKSLRRTLEWNQAFLKDMDAKRRDNERVKVWVDQVRDVSFRAEDTIDRYIYEIQYQKNSGFLGSLKNFVSCIYRLKIRHELGCEIKEISQMRQQISANKSEFGIEFNQPVVGQEASSSLTDSLERFEKYMPVIEEANVVGFDQVKADIKRTLLEGDPRRCVVSIVGMGGVGKTTLATNIYNSNDVKNNFDCHIWISVSQKYKKRELLQPIAKEVLKLEWKEIAEMDIRDMVDKSRDGLRTEKYLLVIDDIWEVTAWKDICSALPNENNGSRIMVTTRKKDVALSIDSDSSIHELQCLNDEESWNLFCSKVFRNKGDCPSELEKMRADIVEKCRGLPLAIVVLGGLLSRKPKSEVEWGKVLNCIKYEFHNRMIDAENVHRILQLSYDDLPYYLRSCFLYLGLYPEDSEIDAERLIRLWVAEGFVQQREGQTLEEVAEEYLEELASRSMIQVVERTSWGRVESCRVHDLLLDLAISRGKEDRFLGILAGGNPSPNHAQSTSITPRRVAVHRISFPELSSQSSLRSLLSFDAEVTQGQVRLLINNLNLLRVLDLDSVDLQERVRVFGFLSRARLKKLPKQIGSMVHLRFLELRHADMEEFPSSIGNLHNLQTLLLPLFRRYSLPPVIWKIKTLRHVSGFFIESSLAHCSCKGGLQTLWGITSQSMEGTKIDEFTNLRNLNIIIDFSSSRDSRMEELFGNKSLAKLTRLNQLTLEFDSGPGNVLTLILSGLADHRTLYFLDLTFSGERERELRPAVESADGIFSPSLTKIDFDGTLLSKQEQSALQRLPNLKILKLSNNAYANSTTEMEFSADGFKKLQELYFGGQEQLEQWIIEKGAMPSLRYLTIDSCPELKMIPKGLQHITTLQQLETENMSDEFTEKLQQEKEADWVKERRLSIVIN